jgi:hypothetical protein
MLKGAKIIYVDIIIMSSLDLNINNYDYDELLNLFKINRNENRSNTIYKLDNQIKKLVDGKLEDYILIFYKKAKNIIIVIKDLLDNDYISDNEILSLMNKIYTIDKKENIAKISEIELLNKIKNNEVIEKIPLNNLNEPNYNVDKMDYILKNNKNTVFNVAVNEVSPGELNSIKRITQLLNLNINSCFRNNYYQSNPTDFLYNLPIEIKNVLSMRLVSIEIPNSWYLFSCRKKNNIFYVIVNDKNKKTYKEYPIEINEGNYDYESFEHYLNTTYFYESGIDYPLSKIKFSINPHSLKSRFEIIEDDDNIDKCLCGNNSFDIKFSPDINQNMINTAGWILGFRLSNYLDIENIVSEGLFDAGGDRYVYLSITDFQYNNNNSNIVCFDKNILNEDIIAKIPMKNGKLSLIINDNSNNLAKIRRYNGPINLSKIQIKLLDQFGSVIDLNNMDFSMAIELEILYENFNFKNITS